MPLVFTSDVSLKPYNTLGIDVPAARWVCLDQLADLPALLADADFQAQPHLILGGGSNIVLTQPFTGTVVKVGLRGIRCVAEEGDAVLVRAAAGESWHDFVRHTLAQGWYGLENLSLIPGSVGASPIQNIGAYGVEVKDRIHTVEAVSLTTGATRCFTAAECRFAYRDSIFKQEEAGKWLITAVTFRLSRVPVLMTGYGDICTALAQAGVIAPTPLAVSDAVIRIRADKLPNPAVLGNVGSFFKNPVLPATQATALSAHYPDLPCYPQADGQVKCAAGWLIDHAGWKGKTLDGAGVHARQALVLVNLGAASGEAVLALAQHIQADVLARYGVSLEIEPLVY